ncbi:hypothetical protein JF540_05690 [Salipiger thiooxidans]|uniref:hypothetical protein n=1 Tax=Salipiger thiooxidans TaxID=282683 RepID=UPI001A8D4787|nr:hypothetical protein [Salipiger thiooxidans]MBN8186174.1 hypothetical protein [Salipiger thiooxidans]
MSKETKCRKAPEGGMDMYIGALVVIIAAGCVFELLEGAAERRRYQRNAQLVDFPGLNG